MVPSGARLLRLPSDAATPNMPKASPKAIGTIGYSVTVFVSPMAPKNLLEQIITRHPKTREPHASGGRSRSTEEAPTRREPNEIFMDREEYWKNFNDFYYGAEIRSNLVLLLCSWCVCSSFCLLLHRGLELSLRVFLKAQDQEKEQKNLLSQGI